MEKGDFLVKLDDASLQKDLLRQRISVHQSKASLVKARPMWKRPNLLCRNIFPVLIVRMKNSLRGRVCRQRKLKESPGIFGLSKKLAAKGYVSEAQLEADQFAVEKARKELDLAQTKLEVLRTHSRKAKVNDLNASIHSQRLDYNRLRIPIN